MKAKWSSRFRFLPDGLGPGPHTADLIFPSQKVRVTLVVPSGTAEFRPPSLVFTYSPAGIPAQKIVVSSASRIPDPKPSEPWVTFKRRNIGSGQAEFTVRVSADKLQPGPHGAFLAFPLKKLPVELVIPGGSTLEVSPAFLAFPAGGAQQRIIVTGPGVLPDPKPSEGWVKVTRASSIPGKAEFLVEVSPEEGAPAKKYANLVFSADRKVQVELTVASKASALDVQPDSLEFPGGGQQQTISVSGPDPIPDPTSTDPWLTFTKRSPGPGKAEFVVQASSSGSRARPHVAYLAFDPQKQVVELTVPVPKPLDVQPTELRFKYKHGGPAPPPQVITATGPAEISEPTKKAQWFQWTRSTSGTKTEFSV